MGSLCKKMLKYGLVAFGTYAGIKLYSIGKSIFRISKTLPEFVKNLYGESPKLSLQYNNLAILKMNLKIKLGFSKSIIENNDDIEETVTEYVQDFYPALSKCKIDVEVYELDSTSDIKSENVEENNNEEDLAEEVKEEVVEENTEDASEEDVTDSTDKNDEE